MEFKEYKRLTCDVCTISHVLTKNKCGIKNICKSCLFIEEQDLMYHLKFYEHGSIETRSKNIKNITEDKPTTTNQLFHQEIDFIKASTAWMQNKKRVKNGNGTFVYV